MRTGLLIGLLLAVGVHAEAGTLAPVSYDMPNGDGTAHGGTFNYWDGNYTGSGNKTVDEAPLSGGLGALTDGVISSQPWYNVSNLSGTGPFVGWVINPTITFHFAGPASFGTIMIHSDDSDNGGVSTPSQAVVSDGVHSGTFMLPDPSNGSGGNPVWLTLDVSSLGLAGNTLSVTLDVRSNYRWVFVDEVQFQSAAVPEPAGPVLLGLGIAGAFALARRRPRG